MRWKKNARKSENIEDRRGASPGKKAAAVGGGGAIIAVIIALISQFTGIDKSMLSGLSSVLAKGKPAVIESAPATETAEEKALIEELSFVLGNTEETWTRLFREMGGNYELPRLVLFRNAVQSACGEASSAVGPFYCPGDNRLYLDLGFFEVMETKLRAGGDFARAYVIAHEVGHHVQNLLGTSRQVQGQRTRISKEAYNKLSVKLELQADYFAGVWAHHLRTDARAVFEKGDIEEAMNAARAVGDDTLQKGAGRAVRPETFTHGTSAQRMKWFKLGFQSGDPREYDPFTDE